MARSTAHWSHRATGTGCSAPRSSTTAPSTSASTCWRSGGSAGRSRTISGRCDTSCSTWSPASPARRARCIVDPDRRHRRRVRCDLRDPRRRDRARAAGDIVLGGSALPLLIVNLAFTFAVPGISIGGHLGGAIGGALCILGALAVRQGKRRLQPDRRALGRQPPRDRRPQRRRRVLEGTRLRLAAASRRSRPRRCPVP